jgi:predicted ATPase
MHVDRIDFYPENYPTRAYYPFTLELLHKIRTLALETPVTLFVGENGTGKSTLLEAIAARCGIYIWQGPKRQRYENNPYESRLCDYISVNWRNGRVPGSFFGSSVFQDFARVLDEWALTDPGQLDYFGGKSLISQSHGQSLMSYFRSRYARTGLYLMDEPETALSPRTQIDLVDLLIKMSRAGHAQFVIATHSPILLACPGARIYSFDQAPIRSLSYEETDHYRLFKAFMENPRGFFDAKQA